MFGKLEAFLNKKGIRKKDFCLWAGAAVLLVTVSLVLAGISGTQDGYSFPVYISEVLASNTGTPNSDGRCCDYIELYNGADYPVDLSGFQLGDIAGNGRYAFPAGTTLEPGGYLVVYCDKTVSDPSYAQFAISRAGGEEFYLIASNNAIVDSVTTLATDPDQAMIRLDPDRWGITSLLTPGWENGREPENGDIYNPQVSAVRITELSAAETGYEPVSGTLSDWVELHNTGEEPVEISGFTLSDNVGNDKFRFPEGTSIPAGGYLVVYCTEQAAGQAAAQFGLSQYGGESLVLKDSAGRIVEIIDTLPMEKGQSMALTWEDTWSVTAEVSPGFENSAQGCQAFMDSSGTAPGSVRISEVMAAQQSVCPDSSGEFGDWVELVNTTDRTIDLAGWTLSDDPRIPDKWMFPQLTLQSGERILVFCSGKDTAENGEYHTGFSLSAGGESVILSASSGATVDSVSFGKSEENQSYIFDSGDAVGTDYPTPGYPNDDGGYEMFCASHVSRGALAIWELMSSNDRYLPQSLGKCYDWVEIRNVSGHSVNLADYALTDDPEAPELFPLPDQVLAPGASVIVILSGDENLTGKYIHGNFTLDAMGDQLFLFSGEGLSDYVSFGQIPLEKSYGRIEGTGGFYYMNPTPGKDNSGGQRLISAEPTANLAPGVYTGEESYSVELAAEGEIYYTLDGSDPDQYSSRYDGPIRISSTAVLRAVAIEEGKLCSGIYTATFVIGASHELPVVSLVTDPANLWGSEGIYKSGDIAIKEEHRPANLSYSGEDGSFSIDCEISLHGETTVLAFSKKSFTLRFRDNYDGPLYYDLFGGGEVTAFSSLILRASHESTVSSHMRDAFLARIANECGANVITQRYKYAALYINGEYWGLYAFREHHSAEHYASYREVPADSVSMVRYCVDEKNSLYAFYNFCEENDLRSVTNYGYAQNTLDLSSFADWIILQAYVANVDINGNMRYYCSSTDNLWRCGLVDVDLGMFSSKCFDEVESTFHHGRIVRDLMQNDNFRELLATRLAEFLAGPLSDEHMLDTIDEMADSIRSEIPGDADRWGYSTAGWETAVKEMKKFCSGRAKEMIDSLCKVCNFTAKEKQDYFGELLNEIKTTG